VIGAVNGTSVSADDSSILSSSSDPSLAAPPSQTSPAPSSSQSNSSSAPSSISTPLPLPSPIPAQTSNSDFFQKFRNLYSSKNHLFAVAIAVTVIIGIAFILIAIALLKFIARSRYRREGLRKDRAMAEQNFQREEEARKLRESEEKKIAMARLFRSTNPIRANNIVRPPLGPRRDPAVTTNNKERVPKVNWGVVLKEDPSQREDDEESHYPDDEVEFKTPYPTPARPIQARTNQSYNVSAMKMNNGFVPQHQLRQLTPSPVFGGQPRNAASVSQSGNRYGDRQGNNGYQQWQR